MNKRKLAIRTILVVFGFMILFTLVISTTYSSQSSNVTSFQLSPKKITTYPEDLALQDAGTGMDAGDTFETALLISPGDYDGNLEGDDYSDYYQFFVDQDDVIRFYLEVDDSDNDFDLKEVEAVIGREYYGPEKVKARIFERLAVRRLSGRSDDASILCLAGAPGTGKASLGKAIAKSLNREFFRVSVGGFDEINDIKGLPRTYINASPGILSVWVLGYHRAQRFV